MFLFTKSAINLSIPTFFAHLLCTIQFGIFRSLFILFYTINLIENSKKKPFSNIYIIKVKSYSSLNYIVIIIKNKKLVDIMVKNRNPFPKEGAFIMGASSISKNNIFTWTCRITMVSHPKKLLEE